MEKNEIYQMACNYVNENEANYVPAENAIEEQLIGMRMYEEPLMACGDARDGLFMKLKEPGIVGEQLLLPGEWLPGAKSVISFFLPFCDVVKKSNGAVKDVPSNEWLHARMEGQQFINALAEHLKAEIESTGAGCIVPSLDPRFKTGGTITADRKRQEFYTSNWSERHAGFICGLGTFGLSRGLITKRGVAGRYMSLIVDFELPYDGRYYTEIYENCNMCGACAVNCPASAISKEAGKDHPSCSAYLDTMREVYKPRYGCGKCQVKVPCESGIPLKRKAV